MLVTEKPLDLKEVFDEPSFQRILNSFVEATGLRAMVIDTEGFQRLVPADLPQGPAFCQLIRSCAKGNEKCRGSYLRAGEQAAELGEPYIFRCHAGLVGWAAPIMFGKVLVGSIICSQVLMWEPEDFFWIEIAEMTRDLPLELSTLIRNAQELPVVSASKVQAAAELLFGVASYLMKTGLVSLRQKRKINEQQARLSQEIQSRKALEKLLREQQREVELSETYSLKLEEEVLRRVRLGDREGAQGNLDQLLGVLLFQQMANPKVIRARLLELLVGLSRAAIEAGASIPKVMDLNYKYMERILEVESVEDLCSGISKILDRFLDEIQAAVSSKNRAVVERILAFVRAHFQKSLSLQEIASNASLSPYHLSRVFKEETGHTVMEYVTKVRLEEAKRLLKDPKYNINEVAQAVGYTDSSYFCKVFKKYEGGITPGDFRQRVGKYSFS